MACQRQSQYVMRFGKARLHLDRHSQFVNSAVALLFFKQRYAATEVLLGSDGLRALRQPCRMADEQGDNREIKKASCSIR